MTTTPETKNGPEVAPASNDFGTANPTATNQKGTHMSTSQLTQSHRCPPWCEHTLRGMDPAEHQDQCASAPLGRADGVDGDAVRRDVFADVTHHRDYVMARTRVRLLMLPRGGADVAVEALALMPAEARSLARSLQVAADVADGLAPVPAETYERRLHVTAAALADRADVAFKEGDEDLADALDAAAAKLRAQAGRH